MLATARIEWTCSPGNLGELAALGRGVTVGRAARAAVHGAVTTVATRTAAGPVGTGLAGSACIRVVVDGGGDGEAGRW